MALLPTTLRNTRTAAIAAAAFGVAIAQFLADDNLLNAAVAATQPATKPVGIIGVFEHRQHAKPFAGHFNRLWLCAECWRCDSLLKIPSSLQSPANAMFAQSEKLYPFSDRPVLAIESHNPAIAPVELLFTVSRPSAIRLAIVSIVVDPLNGMQFCRWVAHVCDECSEFDPARVNCYAASAVMVKGFVILVQASAFHALPRTVGAGPAFRISGDASLTMLRANLTMKTAAAIMAARAEGFCASSELGSTVANTLPPRARPLGNYPLDYCDPAYTSAG
jgi:hypothetical protein